MKLNYYVTIATLALVLLFSQANAQSDFQEKNLEKLALKLFKAQKYSDALPVYLQLDNMSKDAIKYDYMIGMCYLSTSSKEKALPYFLSAKNHPETSFVINYYLGRAYMIEESYAEAKNYLTIYSDSLTNYIASTGLKFKNESITEANRFHMEKSLNHVQEFVNECSAYLEENKEQVSASTKK